MNQNIHWMKMNQKSYQSKFNLISTKELTKDLTSGYIILKGIILYS